MITTTKKAKLVNRETMKKEGDNVTLFTFQFSDNSRCGNSYHRPNFYGVLTPLQVEELKNFAHNWAYHIGYRLLGDPTARAI